MDRLTHEQISHARALRADQTRTEELVWSSLRNRRCCGLKWRRQVPWRGYVLDFYCAELRLVIELDGSQHSDPAHLRADEYRRRTLAAASITVLRVRNEDVLFGLKDLLGMITAAAQRSDQAHP